MKTKEGDYYQIRKVNAVEVYLTQALHFISQERRLIDMRKELKNFILSAALVTFPLFSSISTIVGYEYAGINESPSYLLFTVVLIGIAFLYVFKYVTFHHIELSIWETTILFFVPLVYTISYLSYSIFNMRNSALSLEYYLMYCLFAIPAAFIGFYVKRTDRLSKIERWFEVFALLFSVATIIIFLIPQLKGQKLSSSVTENIISYQTGSYLASFSFGISLYFLFQNIEKSQFRIFKSRIYKVLSIVMICLQFYIAITAGGRGGVVLLFCYLILFLLKSELVKKITIKKLIYVLLAIGFVFIFIFFIYPILLNNEGFVRAFNFLNIGGTSWNNSNGRNSVYNTVIDLIKKQPIIGYGIFNYFDILGYYPHNLFLEILLQGGLIYIVLFMIFLVHYLAELSRYFKNDFFIIILSMYPWCELMFSVTYLTTPLFWFSLGWVLTDSRELSQQEVLY